MSLFVRRLMLEAFGLIREDDVDLARFNQLEDVGYAPVMMGEEGDVSDVDLPQDGFEQFFDRGNLDFS